MKIVVACDSFKGSLDAVSAMQAIESGIKSRFPAAKVLLCPVADGGEGTVKLLTKAKGGHILSSEVHGPLMEKVTAQWGWIAADRTAIIGVAEAAGLTLVPLDKRDPCRTTTFGVGELIKKALDKGAQKIIIGLGGSGTTDGATGLAEALGVHFSGCGHPMSGGQLASIREIDMSGLDKRVGHCEFIMAVDVKNPLLGLTGSAHIFAPQKGASAAQVDILEKGLGHLSTFFPQVSVDFEGAGSAGGLGWGLKAFVKARARSGIDLMLDSIGFDNMLLGADLLISGEGSFDSQSLQGKAVAGVARRAATKKVPVLVLSGYDSLEAENYQPYGISASHSICRYFNLTTDQAIKNADALLQKLTYLVITDYIR